MTAFTVCSNKNSNKMCSEQMSVKIFIVLTTCCGDQYCVCVCVYETCMWCHISFRNVSIKALTDMHCPSWTAVYKRGYRTVLNSGNTNSSSVLLSKQTTSKVTGTINPLNSNLNPICHLLALLGAHLILYVSRLRVNI